jgi:hypothetical protein
LLIGTCPRDRLAFGALPHHQRRRSGDLVRMPGDADLKRATEQIGRATQVHQRWQAGRTNRNAACPAPPGTAEAVADDDSHWHAEPLRQAFPQSRRGAVGIDRQ